MFKAKSIFILWCAVLAVLFFVPNSDAAKGGGGCKDRDGDTYFQKEGCGSEVDCDDNNSAVNPGAAEVCDSIDNNCDGTVDEGCGGCTDNDGDGYGDGPDCLGADCDDADPNTYPGAPLLCDAKDNDCDDTQDFPTDEDKDADGVPWCAGDCDDNNPNRSPDISEGPFGDPTCSDGIDNDCDSYADGVDSDCACTDNDLDGYGNGPFCLGPDCDDTDPSINPGALEVCGNGVDENCDGQDDICPGCTDNDGDGYGDGADCLGPDCDDTDPSINPNASEICDDNVDNNCDGDVDEGCEGCIPTASKERDCDCFDNEDNDCDGSIDSLDRDCKRQTCDTCYDDDGDGWYTCGGDCDDSNPAINPGADDANCNGVDEDCDGIDDDDYVTQPTNCGVGACSAQGQLECSGGTVSDTCMPLPPPYDPNTDPWNPVYCSDLIDNDCDGLVDGSDTHECPPLCTDNDGDGYGSNGELSCPNVGVDCDDTDPSINPGADDSECNFIDDDCDGLADDEYVPYPETCGVGICERTVLIQCIQTVLPQCQPGLPEVEGPYGDLTCSDALDNDCDGLTDGGDGDCVQSCTDSDNDGFAAEGGTCGPVDCDDTDPFVNPMMPETCGDGIDNNCDGEADGTTPGGLDECCLDSDNDGFTSQTFPHCMYPGDCDDTDPFVNPMMPETCGDGIDNNCDGEADGTTPGGLDECCLDSDNDGFTSQTFPHCMYPGDCDDTDPFVNPMMQETCGDGIDNNCDGEADGTTPGGLDECCLDSDNDGFTSQTFPHCMYPGDCDDTDPFVNPMMPETCGDGIDNNCDGEADGTTPGGLDECCLDSDNDGFTSQTFPHCMYPGDCDDTDPFVNPMMPETCGDGIDNNCDGEADGTTPGGLDECCLDSDNDGFTSQTFPHCMYPGDCDDTDPFVNPMMPETCGDGIDNNCDGEADGTTPGGLDECCLDSDNDGFTSQTFPHCMYPGDCDDTDPFVNPMMPEGPTGDPTCSDTKDNDCNGYTDSADPNCEQLCFFNADCTLSTDYCEKAVGDCGGSGSCQPRPEICMPVWGPVCGCDGITYSNDCDAAMAGVNVDYDGECVTSASIPHDMISDCTACHDPGTYVAGAALDNNKCLACHDGSQATMANTHYSNNYIDPSTGLLVDLNCGECHNVMRPQTNLAHIRDVIRGVPIVFPPFDQICSVCHTQTNHYRNDGTGLGHNDGSVCTTCHTHVEGFNVECFGCGGSHVFVTDCNYCHVGGNFADPIPNSQCDQCHTAGGSLKGSYPTAPDVETHQGSSYGVFIIDCVECHDPMNPQVNLKDIRSTIAGSVFPGSQIIFTAYSGVGSFADGAPYNENICDTCHTQTNHHQADGTAPGGQDHQNSQDCTGCHTHDPGVFFPTF